MRYSNANDQICENPNATDRICRSGRTAVTPGSGTDPKLTRNHQEAGT